ncbi:MAG: hypothetical protein AABZ77_04735, partial [Chloroflexota bacterium]
DIKAASAVEAEKAKEAEALAAARAAEEAELGEKAVAEEPEVLEPVVAAAEMAEPLPVLQAALVSPPSPAAPSVRKKPALRFAEDILVPAPIKVQPARSKKGKKKGAQDKDVIEDRAKVRRPRREVEIPLDDEDDEDDLSNT